METPSEDTPGEESFKFVTKKRNKNMRKRKATDDDADDETTIKRGKEMEKKGLSMTTKVEREVRPLMTLTRPFHDRGLSTGFLTTLLTLCLPALDQAEAIGQWASNKSITPSINAVDNATRTLDVGDFNSPPVLRRTLNLTLPQPCRHCGRPRRPRDLGAGAEAEA